MNKILITGASGFVAPHLIKLLEEQCQRDLSLTDRHKTQFTYPLEVCDLSVADEVVQLLKKIKPSQIYHLAGSFTNDFDVDFQANFSGTKNLFDAILKTSLQCRVLLMGSAAEYGHTQSSTGISEDFPLNPVTVYGFTKKLQTELMHYYTSNHKLDLVMARSFNLSGKGISSKLFIGTVYDQIKRYKSGTLTKITVGNLQAERDYIDINQAVKLYVKIMSRGISGEVYNVGTGSPIKLSELLQRVLTEEGLDSSVLEETSFSSSSIMISFADIKKSDRLGD